MSSTTLNEELIVAMLGTTPSSEHGENLRTAGLMVLLDAYDRKVTRDSFFDTARNALQLNEMCGRLESISGIHASMKANLLTAEKLQEAVSVVIGHADTCRKSLIRDMALLMQCPEDEDAAH